MFKILHARCQHCVNWEIPDAQTGFRKGRGARNQITNFHWIIEKAREFQEKKKSTSVSLTTLKPFVWIITNCGKLIKIWEYHNLQQLSCLLRNLYAVQEATLLEPCMEQLIGSRLRKEYNRAVCCHPVCLTNMLSTSWEMLGWVSYKLESWQEGETSTTSDMWMIPL